MGVGVLIVTVLYVLANVAYLNVLPAPAIASAPQDRVGTAALHAILGEPGLKVMAAAIMISTFGCNNGLILSGARVYYAMARDDLFFKSAGVLHPEYKTPAVALVVQAVWTSLLCLSGTYTQLLLRHLRSTSVLRPDGGGVVRPPGQTPCRRPTGPRPGLSLAPGTVRDRDRRHRRRPAGTGRYADL